MESAHLQQQQHTISTRAKLCWIWLSHERPRYAGPTDPTDAASDNIGRRRQWQWKICTASKIWVVEMVGKTRCDGMRNAEVAEQGRRRKVRNNAALPRVIRDSLWASA